MLKSVFSFEESSGALSETYAPGIETVGASPEAVEVAADGAGDTLSLTADESWEGEYMIKEMVIGSMNSAKRMRCFREA